MPPEVLAHTAALLHRGFSRGAPLARTAAGDPCPPLSPRAAAWSVQGALMRAAHDHALEHVMQSARLRVSAQLWSQHGLLLAWAELNPSFTQAQAIEVVEQCARWE